jgi:hypothetical protein
MLRVVAFWIVSLCVVARPVYAQEETPPATGAKVDFLRDVEPIFRERCLDCHGSEMQAGSLRLDRREFALQGGHTGTPLLTPDPSTNGILQRVTSDDATIRMPKGMPPLSSAEIDTLRKWIEQGAEWPESAAREEEVRRAKRREAKFAFSTDDWPGWNPNDWPDAQLLAARRWVFWFAPPVFVLLCLIGLCERSKLWVGADRPFTRGRAGGIWRALARVPRMGYLAALLGLTVVCGAVFYQTNALIADQHAEALRDQIEGLERTLNPPQMEEGVPKPVRPPHPPRLGGEYYRGNDERNPELYNGGFYRTATMRVALCREDHTPLAWGDVLDSPRCLVRFEIEQSPGATPTLFADSIWSDTFISHLSPQATITDPTRQVTTFTATADGVWEAFYPIDVPLDGTAPVIGTLSIYRGDPKSASVSGQAHYAARYSISIADGKIAPDSELWMGYVLRTGNVHVTPPGKIPEDEWFSFRPIPEIIGGQTTQDEKLLGIDDYREELKQKPAASSTSTPPREGAEGEHAQPEP